MADNPLSPPPPEVERSGQAPISVAVQITGVAHPLFIGVTSKDLKTIVKRSKFNVNNITTGSLKSSGQYVLKTKEVRVVDKDGFDSDTGLQVAEPYVHAQDEIDWLTNEAKETNDSDEEQPDLGVAEPDGEVPNTVRGQASLSSTPGVTTTIGSLIGMTSILEAIEEDGHASHAAASKTNGTVASSPTRAVLNETVPPACAQPLLSNESGLNKTPPFQMRQPEAILDSLASKYKLNPLFNPANERSCDWICDPDNDFLEEELFGDDKEYECELVGWFSGGQFVSNYTLSSLQKVWGVNFECNRTGSGWFLFKFQAPEDRQKVLQHGPYVVNRRTLTVEEITTTFQFKPPPPQRI